jgi:P4 family phage/plasmid primase-like protien
VTLSPAHRQELERASAIDAQVIEERGYRTLEWKDRDELARIGIHLTSKESFPGLLLPMFRVTGERTSAQFKPPKPILIQGRTVKYFSPRGPGNSLDVHPRSRAAITDPSVPLWITEGIKKGDALTSRGCCVVTLTGVYNWRNKLATLGDWEDVPLRRREIVLCVDADAVKNMNVSRAMVRLGRWCHSKGAKTVRYLIVPSEVRGQPVKGADDFFAAGGSLDELKAAATTGEPDTELNDDDNFTDARLAERIADEVLADRFNWCKALGWHEWNSQQWKIVTDETVLEAVRQHVVCRFKEAVDQHKTTEVDGWHSVLKATRLHAILTLTKGIVERSAEEFDADPDLINTPSGVVDLRTRTLLPHNPDLLCTKITRGKYLSGCTHSDWTKALDALPDQETRSWLQVRIGQAATGHTTPDGVFVLAQGSGENGKTALLHHGILTALGDYAAPVSPKLIASSKDDHPTERADLRGQRFLIAEELTERGVLNITSMKQISDVHSMRARYVHKDNFTFRCSHSIFITTNYIPIIHETDHGTWRRLALLRLSVTFRKPRETLGPGERRGDAGLKTRLAESPTGQHDAVVTWIMEGAYQFYRHGLPALPTRVDTDTRQWRTTADRILGFWTDRLVADPTSAVTSTDVMVAFNAWLGGNGHHAWSKERFHPAFKSHEETTRHHVELRRVRTATLGGLSRPSGPSAPLPIQAEVYLGVRFRADHEIDENVKEIATCAECADLSGNSPRGDDLEKFPEGSAQSTHPCCEGGPLQLRCKLCQQSPTYWQLRRSRSMTKSHGDPVEDE